MPLTKQEYRVIEKYRGGRRVDDEDRYTLERLTLIGFFEWGYFVEDRTAIPTAKSTERAKYFSVAYMRSNKGILIDNDIVWFMHRFTRKVVKAHGCELGYFWYISPWLGMIRYLKPGIFWKPLVNEDLKACPEGTIRVLAEVDYSGEQKGIQILKEDNEYE